MVALKVSNLVQPAAGPSEASEIQPARVRAKHGFRDRHPLWPFDRDRLRAPTADSRRQADLSGGNELISWPTSSAPSVARSHQQYPPPLKSALIDTLCRRLASCAAITCDFASGFGLPLENATTPTKRLTANVAHSLIANCVSSVTSRS
jgi:hypothetical protein